MQVIKFTADDIDQAPASAPPSEVTPLAPAEEQRFEQWAKANKITDVDDPQSHYDYRGYWKQAGSKPIKFGVDHFPDTFKQHGHPTFSIESKYSAGPTDGGRWEKDTFIPPPKAAAEPITFSADEIDGPAPDFQSTNAPIPPGMLEQAGAIAGDVATGAAKGVGNTVFGLGKLFHDYTPIGRISDAIQPGAFATRPPELVPTNTAQRVGQAGEQIAEFFLPTGAVGKGVRAAEMAKSAILTGLQGGTTMESALSGGIAGLIPGGSVAKKAAGVLETSAEKTMAQALGASKTWAKNEAARLAPEMLKRGTKGTRAGMLVKAEAAVKDVGAKIGAEVDAATKAGTTLDGALVLAPIQQARAKLMTPNAAGQPVVIEGMQATAKQLERLEQFITGLGPDIPVQRAQQLKIGWDRIVAKGGLYGPKAMSSATDNAKAFAFREAATAFRTQLEAARPTLAGLNEEFKFQKGLTSVLGETAQRTQAQGGGLTQAMVGTAGAAAGFASGDSWEDRAGKAALGGFVGKQLISVVQSPVFRTAVSGPMKQALAEALASGNQGRVLVALRRITAALPGQFKPAVAQ